jgi:ABC-type cobalamin transport system ATPase subunit
MTPDVSGTSAGEEAGDRGLRERLSDQAEDAIGKLADDLLENSVINSAIQRALGARDRMAQAQETAMDALNIPSAANLDKVARRIRSIAQRLEDVEDGVEKLDRRLTQISGSSDQEDRLARIEARIEELSRDVATLRTALTTGAAVKG